MSLYDGFENLDDRDKDWIFDKQQELFESGFGKNEYFVQRACLEESIKQFKQKNTATING